MRWSQYGAKSWAPPAGLLGRSRGGCAPIFAPIEDAPLAIPLDLGRAALSDNVHMIVAHTVCDVDLVAKGVGRETVMQLVEPSE